MPHYALLLPRCGQTALRPEALCARSLYNQAVSLEIAGASGAAAILVGSSFGQGTSPPVHGIGLGMVEVIAMNADIDNHLTAVALVAGFSNSAFLEGPDDPLSRSTYILNKALIIPLGLLTILLVPPVTFVLGLAATLTLGVLLIPLSLIWIPLFGIIMGSSRLWLKVPLLRPLLLPLVLIPPIAFVYVSLVPDMGERFHKQLKLALCDSWPYSYLVYQQSKVVYDPTSPYGQRGGQSEAPTAAGESEEEKKLREWNKWANQ